MHPLIKPWFRPLGMVLKTGIPFKILERKCQALIWVGSILIWYDQMNSGWNCRGQQKNSDICGLEGGPNPSKQETCPEIRFCTHRYTNIAMEIHLFSRQMPSNLWIFYGYVSLPECNYHCFEVSIKYHVYTPCHSLAYHVGFRPFLINTQLGAVWYTKREPKHDMMIRYHICMSLHININIHMYILSCSLFIINWLLIGNAAMHLVRHEPSSNIRSNIDLQAKYPPRGAF